MYRLKLVKGYGGNHLKGTRRATRHLIRRGGLGGNISREARKMFWPPLNIFGGGGQEKYVLYLNNKKLTLPTGYSVSQHI